MGFFQQLGQSFLTGISENYNPLSIVGGLSDIGLGIYNTIQQAKNTKYEKKLQREILTREDNAIQRRVADAQAAGFNKFSVIGEGSPAGSVVSTSAPQADYFGSRAVDAMSSMYKLAQEKNSAEQAKLTTQGLRFQNDILKNKKKISDWNTAQELASFLYQNGFTPQIGIDTHGNKVEVRADGSDMAKRYFNRNKDNSWLSFRDGGTYLSNRFLDTKFGYNQYMNYQERKNFFEMNYNDKTVSDINAKWAEEHQILNMLMQIMSGINKGASSYRFFKGWK